MNTENLIETNDSGILWQTFSLPSSCPGENVFCRLAQPQTPFPDWAFSPLKTATISWWRICTAFRSI